MQWATRRYWQRWFLISQWIAMKPCQKKLKAEKMKTNGFRYGRGLKHGDTIRTHLNPFNDDWCVATAIRKLAEQTVLPGLPILVRCDEESASVYPPLHSSVLHFSHLVSAPLRPEEWSCNAIVWNSHPEGLLRAFASARICSFISCASLHANRYSLCI